MRQRPALAIEIERLLMEHWDPVGVRGIPDAADEYDAYADLLAQRRWGSAGNIADMLNSIEVDNMDLAGNPERAARAAAHIFALISAKRQQDN